MNHEPIIGYRAEFTPRAGELPLCSEVYRYWAAAERWIDRKLARFPHPAEYKILPVRGSNDGN